MQGIKKKKEGRNAGAGPVSRQQGMTSITPKIKNLGGSLRLRSVVKDQGRLALEPCSDCQSKKSGRINSLRIGFRASVISEPLFDGMLGLWSLLIHRTQRRLQPRET